MLLLQSTTWEIHAYLTGIGVLAAYILLRLRTSGRRKFNNYMPHPMNWIIELICFAFGCSAAALIYVAVAVIRGENFVADLWANLDRPSKSGNPINGLLLVLFGWIGWSLALSEILRMMVSRSNKARAKQS